MPWSNQAVNLIVLEETAGFSGLFAYSPAPGQGNLADSVTAAAGVDPFGNPYQAGFTVYQPGTRLPSGVQHSPVYNAGWADGHDGGGVLGLRYWLGIDVNAGLVYVQGTFNQTSASPSANLFTFPAGFIPAADQFIPGTNWNGAVATACLLEVDSVTGIVVAPIPAPGSGNDCILNCVYRLVA